MKALIICSLHALCDISRSELDACNRACALHGIPVILTPQDHTRALAATTMLDLLSHLPGSKGERNALIGVTLLNLGQKLCCTDPINGCGLDKPSMHPLRPQRIRKLFGIYEVTAGPDCQMCQFFGETNFLRRKLPTK